MMEAANVSLSVPERKTARKSVQDREKTYRAILENIEDGYYEVDLSGNFTFFNDHMCKQLAYSPKEISDLDYRRLLNKANARRIAHTFGPFYEGGYLPRHVTSKSFERMGRPLVLGGPCVESQRPTGVKQ